MTDPVSFPSQAKKSGNGAGQVRFSFVVLRRKSPLKARTPSRFFGFFLALFFE